MKSSWLKGADKQEELDIRASFAGSLPIRRRLREIAKEKINAVHATTTAVGAYECPNWAYKQADKVGYTRAMELIISLLDDVAED
jgi:hypothetical protein